MEDRLMELKREIKSFIKDYTIVNFDVNITTLKQAYFDEEETTKIIDVTIDIEV